MKFSCFNYKIKNIRKIMKFYCSSCGADNSYTINRPNFCQKCGENFSGASAQTTTASSQALEADEQDADHVPNISSLDFDIQREEPVKGVKFGALAQLGENAYSAPDPSKKKFRKKSKKKVLEQLKQEGGSVRPTDG